MIQSDKRPKQESFGNITDYSQECPKGFKSYYAFVDFEDGSQCLLDRIFAKTRLVANAILFQRFADCLPYMTGWRMYEE